MTEAYNIDCLIGMAQYPDKYFDLAVVDKIYLYTAMLTSTYVYYIHENIQRITDRESRRIFSVLRFNLKRICCIPFGAGTSLRCAFRYWKKNNSCAGENHALSAYSSAASEGKQNVHIQHKEVREICKKHFNRRGCGFDCACLFRHAQGWLFTIFKNAKHNKYKSRSIQGYALRRERNTRLSKSYFFKRLKISDTNSKGFRASCCSGKQNAKERLQAA